MPLTLPDDTLSRASAAAFSARADADVWGLGFSQRANQQIDDLSLPDDTQNIAANPLPIMVSPQPQVQWPQPRAPQTYTQTDAGAPGQVAGSSPVSGVGEASLSQSSSTAEQRGGTASPLAQSGQPFASNDERLAYVADAATRYGHDPSVAQAVARSEGAGPAGTVGDQGTSFGALQAHVGGGQGDDFRTQTGLDPSDPANERALIDWQMGQVGQTGWTPFHGAAAAGIGPWQGVGTGGQSWSPSSALSTGTPSTATARTVNGPSSESGSPISMPEQASQQAGAVRPTQFAQGLSYAEAVAACGLAGVAWFIAKTGRTPQTVAEVRDAAAANQSWDPGSGMHGAQATAGLLRQYGIAAHVEDGVDWDKVRRDVFSGNPVMFDTDAGSNGHYYTVQQARQRSDGQWEYDLGTSATDLRSAQGQQWFTADQIEGLGFGRPARTIFTDNPQTSAPSPAAGRSAPTAASSPSDAASPAAPAVAGSAQPAAAGAPDPLRDQIGASAGGVVNYRQPLQQPADEPSPAGGAPTIGGVPILPQPADWQAGYRPTVYPPLQDRTIGPYPSGIQTVQGSTTNPIRNQAVRGDPPDEYGDRSFAPDDRVQYRQPLTPTQGDTATGADVPYDPRQYDQGAHEVGYTVGGGASADPASFPPAPTGAPAAGQSSSNGAAPTVYGPSGDQPQTPAYTPPAPPQAAESPLKPLYDLAGQVIGYVHTAADQLGQAMSAAGTDNPTPEEQAQRASVAGLTPGEHLIEPPHILAGTAEPVQSTTGEPDYVPRPGLMDIVGQNTGFAASQRMRQIEANAAAAQGITDPVRAMQAPSNPAWRAQNPEMAQEYDDLQQQLAFVVGGTFGSTSGGQSADFVQQMQAAQARYQQARVDLVRASDSLREAQAGGLPSEVRQWQRVVNRAQVEHTAALSQIDAVRATAPIPQRAIPEMEPSFRSDVGARYPDIRRDVQGSVRQTLGEPSAEMLADSRYPRDVVNPDIRQNMGPPLTEAPDMGGRMNAQAGPQAAGAADNLGRQAATTVGNFTRGAMTGGIGAAVTDPGSPQGENESDADYAARRAREVMQRVGTGALGGGAAFAGAGALMRRGGSGALQMGGPQGQGPAPVPGFNRGQAQRLQNAMVQAQNAKPPSVMDIIQHYRNSWGLLGQPAGGLVNALGGPVSIALGLPTEAIKTGLMKGYPAPVIYQAASLMTGLKAASQAAIETTLGRIPPAVRAAPDFRPPLNETLPGVSGSIIGHAIDTPGRLMAQVPDAFWNTLFQHWGESRAASEIMAENGISRLRPDQQVAEINRLLNNPTPQEANRIADGAKAFADEMTYRGDPGYWEKALGSVLRPGGKVTTSADPAAQQVHDLLGSFVMPFYSALFKIQKLGMSYVPVVGSVANRSLPSNEKIARQLVGLGFGIWAADYASKGFITGPGPDDPNEQERLKATGWAPWSTYVPHIGYVPSNDLAQAAPILKMIGGYYDAGRYATPQQQGSQVKTGDRVVKSVLGAFSDFPATQAFQSIYQMTQKPIEGLTDLGVNVASQFVPALVRAKETAADPYSRHVDTQNSDPMEQARQKLLSRTGSVPGLGSRQDLAPVLDRKGEPVANPRAGWGSLLPRVSPEKPPDPISGEMSTYGVNLDKPRDHWTMTRAGADAPDGAPGTVNVSLTPEMQQQWLRYRWQRIQESAPAVQADPRYRTAPDVARQKVWQNVLSQAETYADRATKAAIGRPALEDMLRGVPAPAPVRRAS